MIRNLNWFQLCSSRFGLLSTWVLCAIAIVLALLPASYSTGERLGPGSIFGFLPSEVLQSELLYHTARILLLINALLWIFHRFVPWSSWLTVLSFTLIWSLRMENTSHAAHIFNASNMLLFVHAMWFHFYRRPMRTALRENRLWSSECYPNWVFYLSVFYLCWFHTWAGLTKLQNSGLDWGNGLSLQIWVYLWGAPKSPTTQLLLSSRSLTRLLQTGALFFETTSIVGVLHRWLRWIVGFNLLGFYLGVLTTFVDYGFHMNAILVAMFLLPTREWIDRRSRKEIATQDKEEAASVSG